MADFGGLMGYLIAAILVFLLVVLPAIYEIATGEPWVDDGGW